MIDLRIKGLPNTICVNGKPFSIHTDFRKWLEFGELIKKERPIKDFYFLFKNNIPNCDFTKELFDFYANKNSTPRSLNESHENVFDYIQDGEYLTGSFKAVYGIDLTTVGNLHWQYFQALFRSLPDDSKMMQIISMRAYKKNNDSMEQQLQKSKKVWSFLEEKERSEEELEDLKNEFYGAI